MEQFRLTGDSEIDSALPACPKLLDETIFYQMDSDSALISGGLRSFTLPLVLDGLDVKDILIKLNGKNLIECIAEGADCSEGSSFKQLLWALLHNGYIEEDASLGFATTPEDTKSFLGIVRDQTRVHANRKEQLNSLLDNKIIVVGKCRKSVGTLVEKLNFSVGEKVAFDDPNQVNSFYLRVVLGDAPVDVDAFKSKMTLYLSESDGSVSVGPLVVNEYCAQPDNLILRSELFSELFYSISAHYILMLCSGSLCASIVNNVIRFSMKDGSLESHERVPVPAVSRLANPITSEHHQDALDLISWLYMPPIGLVGNKLHEMHYAPSNIQMARELPTSGGVVLAPDRFRILDKHLPLLNLVFGYEDSDGELGRRRCPTGGNLGSPECLVSYASNEGKLYLYFYAPEANCFEFVDERVIDPPVRESVVLHCLGNVQKTSKKYGRFGKNIVFLDAGVAKALLSRVVDKEELIGWNPGPDQHSEWVEAKVAERTGLYERIWSAEIDSSFFTYCKRDFYDDQIEALGKRFALRDYDSMPVPPVQIAKVVEDCFDVQQLSIEGVDIYLVVGQDTDGIGVHKLQNEGNGPEFIQISTVPGAQLVNQHELNRAPAKLFFLYDLEIQLQKHGKDHYFETLLSIGTWVGRLWFDLHKHNLGGCPAGASIECEIMDVIQPKKDGVFNVFCFVLGYMK